MTEEANEGPITQALKRNTGAKYGGVVAGSGIGAVILSGAGLFANAIIDRMDKLDERLRSLQSTVVRLEATDQRLEEINTRLRIHAEKPAHSHAQSQITLMIERTDLMKEEINDLEDRIRELEGRNQ